jgi:hypothetical protein
MSRRTRFVTLLFAAVQFAVPAVASVIDGAMASGGRNSAAHVESKGDRDCKPPHSADCAICQFLSGTHAQAVTSSSAVFTATANPMRDASIACATIDPRYGFDSRAPPTLLD